MSERPGVLILTDDLLNGLAVRSELGDRLPEVSIDRASADDDPAALADAEIAVARTFTEEHLESAPDLRWLHVITAGYDHLPLDALESRGVVVTNGSGVNAEPVAEQVLGFLLAFERGLHRAVRQQVAGEWDWYAGTELRGKTVGVVGLGAIGGRVAELARAFGTTVIGTKRDPSTAPEAVDEAYGPADLDAVLARSDYVVVTCPLTPDTRGLIDADALAAMGEDAVLVNVARGEIVDQPALVEALESGAIGGAALDVFETEPLPDESPLWDRDDVVLTPHMAGSTPAFWRRTADIVAENYERFVAGDVEGFRNRVR